MASKSKIIPEVIKHANSGKFLLGICNGFQILSEIGLLRGALIQNNMLKFLGKDCFVRKKYENKFNKLIKKDQVLQIPVAHNEGNFYCSNDDLNYLNDENLIAFEYCKGSFSNTDANINGSINSKPCKKTDLPIIFTDFFFNILMIFLSKNLLSKIFIGT